jgi:hypothetical protein
MLNGTRGIGKSSFAKEMAAILLMEEQSSSAQKQEIQNLLKEGGHTDFISLDMNSANRENTFSKSEIGVEQIRKAMQYLQLTPAIATRKILLVDAIDEVNFNGQNALLKILEEPIGRTQIFLICHRLSGVLSTIKSRSSLIYVPNPTFDQWQKSLKNFYAQDLVVPENKLKRLYEISNFSPGTAFTMLESGWEKIWEALWKGFGDRKMEDLQQLIENISRNGKFNVFKILLENFIAVLARCHATHTLVINGENYGKFLGNSFFELAFSRILETIEQSWDILLQIDRYNFDETQAAISIFSYWDNLLEKK